MTNTKRRRKNSLRLRGYDYSSVGAYFVTIVAWQREMLFGKIVGREVVLNEMGEIVRDEWERTPTVRPYVELGAYVVMPNHLHGILIFNEIDTVGATQRVSPTQTTLQSGSLGAVIGQFKSIATKRINTLHNSPGVPVWQRNYHDRIIRNEREMSRIWDYIDANPARWDDDDENPRNW